MSGGAVLEAMEPDDSGTNGNKRPLLILNRTQQVRASLCRRTLLCHFIRDQTSQSYLASVDTRGESTRKL